MRTLFSVSTFTLLGLLFVAPVALAGGAGDPQSTHIIHGVAHPQNGFVRESAFHASYT